VATSSFLGLCIARGVWGELMGGRTSAGETDCVPEREGDEDGGCWTLEDEGGEGEGGDVGCHFGARGG
jgi:hypothetical protein